MVAQRERTCSPSFTSKELRTTSPSIEIFALLRRHDAMRSEFGNDRVCVGRQPGQHRPVFETELQLHLYAGAAVKALDDPKHRRRTETDRHEIHDRDLGSGGRKPVFEDKCFVLVTARLSYWLAHGAKSPIAVPIVAEQSGKAGRRVEPRPAEPIDRTVAGDERRSFAVADHSIIFEKLAHNGRPTGDGAELRRSGAVSTLRRVWIIARRAAAKPLMRSAVRQAMAWMVRDGLTPPTVGKTEPSQIQRLRMSQLRQSASTTLVRRSSPIRAVPLRWQVSSS